MQNFLLLFFLLVASMQTAKADGTKTIPLSFSESQFSLSYNDAGALVIAPSDGTLFANYENDTSRPGLPWICVDIEMPLGTTLDDFSVSASNDLLYENVVVAANPTPIKTDGNWDQSSTVKFPQYADGLYPSENVRYVTTTVMEDRVIMHFLVCPYEYDAQNKTLNFIKQFTLNVLYKNEGPTTKEEQRELFLRKFSDAVAFGPASSTNFSTSKVDPYLQFANDSIDYIIITSKKLSDEFDPWVRWKKQKGLRANMAFVEDIEACWADSLSTENAIKLFLAKLYYNNGLKYALLGGDDTVVPAKKCCGLMGFVGLEDRTIPTDMFYACLDYENMYWDKNENGICGEVTDNINMAQSISVTRLPVRSSVDVNNALTKLLGYEKNPTANGWNNNFLTAGTRISYDSTTVHSDAEISGDLLYKRHISPYWTGTRKKFYDTLSDVEDQIIDKDGLQNQLAKGYNFVDLICHGGEDHWGLYYQYVKNSPASKYMTENALALENSGYTVVTTNACSTNAFDWTEDPCFSEALMRSPNSGVVAYLGGSRYGWYSYNLGGSLQFISRFYENLFSSLHKDKNFGSIVAAAKTDLIGICGQNTINRWIMFSLNPMGDPETPIYTTTPSVFESPRITLGQNTVTVDTQVEGCNICVMSTDDNGATYYDVRKNTQNATFNDVTTNVSVCITKQNYIPRIYELKANVIKGDRIVEVYVDDRSDKIDIITEITSGNTGGVLKISSTTGNGVKSYNVSSDNSTISDDVSSLDKGIYVVSLYVNGTLVDSKNIVIK